MKEKELKQRGWSNTDIEKLPNRNALTLADVKWIEKKMGKEWNKERKERKETRETKETRRQTSEKHDANLINNGGLWIDSLLSENTIKFKAKLYGKQTNKLATARHEFTHYDVVVEALNLPESKALYKKLINKKLIKMYPWLKN